jgi:hypothetical protein
MAHLSGDSGYIADLRAERLLNAVILGADIREGYEEYLAILDQFYGDGIEASSEGCQDVVTGKAALRSRVAAFLVPLHIFTEVGGVGASLHVEPLKGDVYDETHSLWTLEITGATGKQSVLKWRCCRRWRDERVVYERHTDIEQTGGPLTENDVHLFRQARSAEEFI